MPGFHSDWRLDVSACLTGGGLFPLPMTMRSRCAVQLELLPPWRVQRQRASSA